MVASLTPEVAIEVRDLILRPPEADPYSTLKDTLIKRTAASEQRRFQQLLQAEELGDRKPTQLLRCMLQLLGDKASVDEVFLRELFLQRLPGNVWMVLAASTDSTHLSNLAELADKVMEVAGPTGASISHTATTPTPPLPSNQSQTASAVDSCKPSSANFEWILNELARLQSTVSTLTKASSDLTPSRSRRRSPARVSSPSRQFCWYHQKFGDDARKCVSPCDYPNDTARR